MLGTIIQPPQSKTVDEGDDVTLSCKSDAANPANWHHRRSPSDESERICYKGKTVVTYVNKFYCNSTADVNDLFIRNAHAEQAGEYTCIENAGLGAKASASLTVRSTGIYNSTLFLFITVLDIEGVTFTVNI